MSARNSSIFQVSSIDDDNSIGSPFRLSSYDSNPIEPRESEIDHGK